MVKQVIVVRKDLNMRKGKLAAQVAHASMKAIFGDRDDFFTSSTNKMTIQLDENLREWLTGSFTKIVVGCDSEEDLLRLKLQASEEGVRNALIQDNGTTEFHGIPTYTALAIGPDRDTMIDPITRFLKLL